MYGNRLLNSCMSLKGKLQPILRRGCSSAEAANWCGFIPLLTAVDSFPDCFST